MIRLLVASLMLLSTSAVMAGQNRVPAEFHGFWDMEVKSCGKTGAQLIISKNRLDFHESTGKVKAVKMLGNGTIELDLAFSGEGETWAEAKRFQLSADGQSLIDVTDEEKFARVRCPSR